MSEALYVHSAQVFTPERAAPGGAVLLTTEGVAAVGASAQVARPSGTLALDADGLIAAPGFIDAQFNGAFGMDFTADPTTIWAVGARLPRYGVTAFLPTIITAPLTVVEAALAVFKAGPPLGYAGARVVGLHLEGPYLNPAKRGAHNPHYLRTPPREGLDWSVERGVRLVTLAPELPGALELVRGLRARGVTVSAGHSLATYAEAEAGLAAGLTYGTHLFNAMPALDHREPGLAAALLTDRRAVVGVIPDGIHLHPAIVKLIWQAKGAAGVNVVTDAMAALGMPPGQYRLGDFEVTTDGRSARLADGRLAGSCLSLDQAVRNLAAFTGCAAEEALATVTTVPAAALNLSRHGCLAPGAHADLVLLTPELEVVATIVKGAVSYWRSPADQERLTR